MKVNRNPFPNKPPSKDIKRRKIGPRIKTDRQPTKLTKENWWFITGTHWNSNKKVDIYTHMVKDRK